MYSYFLTFCTVEEQFLRAFEQCQQTLQQATVLPSRCNILQFMPHLKYHSPTLFPIPQCVFLHYGLLSITSLKITCCCYSHYKFQPLGLLYPPQVNPYRMGMEWMESRKQNMNSTFIPPYQGTHSMESPCYKDSARVSTANFFP